MNRSDAMETIREAANKHGFEFDQTNSCVAINDGLDWREAWVNFTIYETPEWNHAEKTVTVRITAAAATARMGGSQTTKDLRTAANAITRAADLVDELNGMNLSYTISFEEEQGEA